MSNLATAIQDWVRDYADATEIVLTSGEGLRRLNEVYHGMFNPDYALGIGGGRFRIGRNWPEVYVVSDLGVNTTSGTAAYAWLTSTIYREEPIVELETSAGSGDYEPVPPGLDEEEWVALQNASNSRPERYRRLRSGTTMQIEFAPTPNVTNLDIRLRGQTEITKFTATTAIDGTTNTIFFNEEPDQALSYFIAALYKAKRGDSGRAVELVQSGIGLLPATDYMPSRDTNQITSHYP